MGGRGACPPNLLPPRVPVRRFMGHLWFRPLAADAGLATTQKISVIQKYFENISKISPQYFQSITQLQEECMKTCEKTISAVVSVQQEFAKKSGFSTEIPDNARTAIVDTNKQIIKAKSVQNQIIQATTNAIQKNIQTWNNSASTFTDLNKNILQS